MSTTTPSSASAATRAGLNHLSYEAADIDDMMVGNEHLQEKGYEHMWGIGRHLDRQPGVRLLGRPVGPGARALGRHRRAERHIPPNLIGARQGTGGPWGQPIPAKFMGHAVR